jgi:hypothetical protein
MALVKNLGARFRAQAKRGKLMDLVCRFLLKMSRAFFKIKVPV